MKSKKVLALVMSLIMIFSTMLPSFAEKSVDSVYLQLYVKMANLFNNNNRDQYVKDIYTVLDSLDHNSLNSKVEYELSQRTQLKKELSTLGFNKNKIVSIVQEIKAVFPNTEEELKNSGSSNLFSKLYNDFYEVDEEELRDEIEDITIDIYGLMPNGSGEFLDVLNEYYDITNRELVKQMIIIGIDEKIGNVVHDTYTDDYKVDLYSDEKTLFEIKKILSSNLIDKENIEKSDELAQTFYDLGSVILEAIEDVAKESRKNENALGELLTSFDYATKETINSKPTDEGGDSSDGGSGEVTSKPDPIVPDPGYDEENDESIEEINNIITDIEADINEEEQNELEKKIEDIIVKMEDEAYTSEFANEQVKSLNKGISKAVESLDIKKGAEVVDELTQYASKVLDNPNISMEESVDMVNSLIETSFTTLLNKKSDGENLILQDTKNVSADISRLLEKTIEKNSTINIQQAAVPSEGDGNDEVKFEVSIQEISDAISKAEEMKEQLTQTLEDNGLGEKFSDLEQNISIKLPEVKDEQKISFVLEENMVENLENENVGLTVETGGIGFKLPVELLKSTKTSLRIESAPISKSEMAALSNDTQGGKINAVKTMNLYVGNSDQLVNDMVELSFSLTDLNVTAVENLSVGVYENEKWTKLFYEIKDNKAVFTAPHFSTFALMEFELGFVDVEQNWAKDCITRLTSMGIVGGKSDEIFDPKGVITRAEFTKMLVESLCYEDMYSNDFKDVNENAWYYCAICCAQMHDFYAGVVDGNFRPNEPITREEMAVMIVKAYKSDNGFELLGKSDPFMDQSEISEDSIDAVSVAKACGIINGYSDNSFKPKNNATRAEAAKIIETFLTK